jgi:hypothetical protein
MVENSFCNEKDESLPLSAADGIPDHLQASQTRSKRRRIPGFELAHVFGMKTSNDPSSSILSSFSKTDQKRALVLAALRHFRMMFSA